MICAEMYQIPVEEIRKGFVIIDGVLLLIPEAGYHQYNNFLKLTENTTCYGHATTGQIPD